jgi:hypothetical protein
MKNGSVAPSISTMKKYPSHTQSPAAPRLPATESYNHARPPRRLLRRETSTCLIALVRLPSSAVLPAGRACTAAARAARPSSNSAGLRVCTLTMPCVHVFCMQGVPTGRRHFKNVYAHLVGYKSVHEYATSPRTVPGVRVGWLPETGLGAVQPGMSKRATMRV